MSVVCCAVRRDNVEESRYETSSCVWIFFNANLKLSRLTLESRSKTPLIFLLTLVLLLFSGCLKMMIMMMWKPRLVFRGKRKKNGNR